MKAGSSMTTNWNDPELNPLGLAHVNETHLSPQVKVTMTARALAYFKDNDGKRYLCAFVNDENKRGIFVASGQGYEEVKDQGIAFTISRMTDEIISRRNR
jgi:hypothetical protein